MAIAIQGTPIVGGAAQGMALVTDEPISFWGGYDYNTGEITDRRHPLSGENAAGCILIVPFSRGSSTTTAVLLEAIRAKTAPAAIISTNVDPFFALASIVAEEMYAQAIPIVVITANDCASISSGDRLVLDGDGKIYIQPSTDL